MKFLIAILLITNLSGCAWIALDRYYKTDGSNDQWQSEFRPGKTSTKWSGYPDTQIHSFVQPEFKLSVNISYQDVAAFGPLIVPIIPTPWDTSRELMVEANIYTESEIELDLSTWQVSIDGKSYIPKMAHVTGLEETTLGKIKFAKDSTILAFYKLKVSELDLLSVEFGQFSSGNDSIKIPTLNLTKTKGTWHYEMWTL